MTDNPYQPPQSPSASTPKPEVDIRADVQAPAISLIVVASIGLLLDIPMAYANYLDATHLAQANDMASATGLIGGAIGLILMHIIVLLGAVNMLRLRSLQFAKTAAIVSLVPMCTPGCLLGIPFGIWALVVLSRFAVEEAFERH